MFNETDEKLEEKYNLCIKSLEMKKDNERDEEDIKNIQTYLNTLFYFRRLKLYDPINVDNTIVKISKVIKYISIQKNNYVLKLGEKGNAFYLILKGKVSIMIAEYKKVYLTIEDYLVFLLKLYYFKEKDLLKETIFLNKHRYMIEGNFEDCIKNLYKKQKALEREIKKENKYNRTIIKEKNNIFSDNLIKMIEKIFPEIVGFSENKNKNDKGNTYIDYIFNNNFKENEVTPDKIIALVNIDHYSAYEKYLYKSFSIPFYFQINILERGKYFGHTALETNSKGSITIITLQDSSFGIIEKNDYFRLLSKINKELDNNFYTTLYNLPFFKNITKSVFQKFYVSYFEYHLYKKNKLLYKMKKKTNILYLIKNGRFSIYIKGNMIDVYDILIYLQTEKIKKLNKNKTLDDEELNSKYKVIEKDERDELIYNKKYKNKEFNDAVYAKNEIFLGNLEGNNLIGLVDFVNKNNSLSLFNIKLESNFSELYEISRKNFNTIVSDYSFVSDIVEEIEIQKLDIMINIITTYKKNFFSSLELKEKENISTRLNLLKKEKEASILNKTQKALKVERLKKNIFFSFDKNIFRKTSINNNMITLESKYHINSFRTFENKNIQKNNSEQKKKLFIKEKILERQNKFLVEKSAKDSKNNVLESKLNFLSKVNSNERFYIKRQGSNNNNSNKFNISLSNRNINSNYIVPDKFFVDKIKQKLYADQNNNFNNTSKQPLLSSTKNEDKLFYINMFINGNNNISCRKLTDSRNKFFKGKINKSVGTIERKKNNLNFARQLINKEIKIENNKLDNLKSKENNNSLKKKLEKFRQSKKFIIDKLKINIKKLQLVLDLSNEYNLNSQKFFKEQNELKMNKYYEDDLFY